MANKVNIRMPPLELDLLGTKVQIDVPNLSCGRTLALSDQELRTLKMLLDLLSMATSPNVPASR